MGAGDQQSARRCVEYRHWQAQMESRLSEEGGARHEAGSTGTGTTAKNRAAFQAHLSPPRPEWLCTAGLSSDKRRRVLPARSESESTDCQERRLRRLCSTLRDELWP